MIYECDDVIEELQEVCNVCELEDCQQAMLLNLEVIVDDHDEADEEIRSGETSKTNQSLLSNTSPWRMANAKKDWL